MSVPSPPESINPESPVPLYHQIAEAIRARIVRGDLRTGDVLDPMRRAAERFGVNLHTVRHAYAALAREGLLEMRSAQGTRVTEVAASLRREVREDVDAFVSRFVGEATERYGLGARDLATRVKRHAGEARPRVSVVECNQWQCLEHAREVTQRWSVDALAWPLSNSGEPGGDAVLATFFHYNDIRRRWPHLLERVRFLTVRVADEIVASLRDQGSVVVLERDEPTAEAVVADLKIALGGEVDLRMVVTSDPVAVVSERSDERVLCSPRVWSDLAQELRADERFMVVRYEFDETELVALASELAWPVAQPMAESL